MIGLRDGVLDVFDVFRIVLDTVFPAVFVICGAIFGIELAFPRGLTGKTIGLGLIC